MARIVFKLEDGTEIETELDSDVITIGRHSGSTVVLPSASVSSHHATLKRRGESWFVQDLGTTNGTKLNGVEVEEAKLEEGDRLTFGDIPSVVYFKAPPERKEKAEAPEPRKGGKVKPGAKPAGRRGYASATYTQSSGCAGFLILLVFLTLAFLGGLFIAHAMKHKQFLLTDFVEVARDKWFRNANDAPLKSDKKDEPKKEEAKKEELKAEEPKKEPEPAK